jgi:hypothetical protein
MNDLFDTLAAEAARGPADLFATLAASLIERKRWHALFDLRLLEARAALGLPLTGDLGPLEATVRDALDERSLAACREVGWPLLDEGSVAAAWMYLRAAAEPATVATKLRDLAARLPADSEAAEALHGELLHVALWEGIDPALGLELVLEAQGTCNAITAYEQAVSRLPAARQQAAAAVLVAHLHRELLANLAADLERRGLVKPDAPPTSLVALLAAAGGLADDPSVHVDVSHLQSVLRIARVVSDRTVIEQAWELASYASRLPAEATYPGEPPFENVGEASRLFYAALLGRDVEAAVKFFRAAAATARLFCSGGWAGRPRRCMPCSSDRPTAGCRASCRRVACCRRSWRWQRRATRSTRCARPAATAATRSRSPRRMRCAARTRSVRPGRAR